MSAIKTKVGELPFDAYVITQYCGEGDISVSNNGVISFTG